MPDPSTTASMQQDVPHSNPARRPLLSKPCRRNARIALGVIIAVGAGVLWRDSHADALLTRIHHGLVICASGKAATATLPEEKSASASTLSDKLLPTHVEPIQQLPTMVSLGVTRSPEGVLLVTGDHPVPLNEALSLSYKRHELVMLTLANGAPATDIVQAIRSTGMRKRTVLFAQNTATAREALNADRSIIVAFPVHSTDDERKAKRLAGRHPFAVYLPANAAPSLFQIAHREADAVIANSPDPTTNQSATRQLLNEPVDIVVTDHPDTFADILDQS